METKSPTIGAWEPGPRRGPELPSPTAHPSRPGGAGGSGAPGPPCPQSRQWVRPPPAFCERPHTMGGNVVREPRPLPGHAGGRLPFVREEREERQSSDSLLATAWGPAPVGAHAPPGAGTWRPRGTPAPGARAPGNVLGLQSRSDVWSPRWLRAARGAAAGDSQRQGLPLQPRAPARTGRGELPAHAPSVWSKATSARLMEGMMLRYVHNNFVEMRSVCRAIFHLKRTTHWFLAYSQVNATIARVNFRTFTSS